MSKITGNRLLRKLVPPVTALMQSTNTWVGGLQNQGSGWQIVNPGVADMEYLVWRGYIDITGFNEDDLTVFVQGTGFQQAESVFMAVPVTGQGKEWCMLSKAYISDDAFSAANHQFVGAAPVGWYAPGMLGSNYNLEEIFTGRYREFSHDVNTPYSGMITHQSEWGSGDATAGDKLYITIALRGYGFTQAANGLILYPPTSVIVPASLAEEKDLQYMERLRRSYVLAESRNP